MEGLQPRGEDRGAGKARQTSRGKVGVLQPRTRLDSWPPNCTLFQASRSRSGTTRERLQFKSVGQEDARIGRVTGTGALGL